MKTLKKSHCSLRTTGDVLLLYFEKGKKRTENVVYLLNLNINTFRGKGKVVFLKGLNVILKEIVRIQNERDRILF